MVDREKAIKGLECCILRDPDDKQRCSECHYEGNCVNRLKMDALTMLKAQEPRVITLEELSALPIDTPVFIEENNDECGWNVFYGIDEEKDVCFCGFRASADYYDLEEYGESWRCWTSRSTNEQREAAPWE